VLLMGLTPACETFRENAENAVRSAVQSIHDLQFSGRSSTGLPPAIQDDSVRRTFALTARTKSNSIEFQIVGSVCCSVSDSRLTYERSALRIDPVGFNFMPVRNTRVEFDGVNGSEDAPSYIVDQAAFQAVLEQAAAAMSEGR
jgi:hypothetical protein